MPGNVVHYAVEDARRALRTISRAVRTIHTRPPTAWTFCGHWDNGRIVVDYILPGEVADDRQDGGTWPEGLWAAAGSGATVDQAQAAVIAAYQDDDEQGTPPGAADARP